MPAAMSGGPAMSMAQPPLNVATGDRSGINAAQPQLQMILQRLRNAQTKDEREVIFHDLKKTPHLFAAFLKMKSSAEVGEIEGESDCCCSCNKGRRNSNNRSSRWPCRSNSK
jgi:hypothetical protein